VRYDQDVIEIRAGQAKTAARRLIPILPNLAEWLEPYKAETGKIGYANSERIARALAKKIGIAWIHNGLRHGFGSHRLAATKNAAQVAHEMGNTERMVHAHYKELVTEAQGNEWFGIVPEIVAKL
jgi:integrase